MDGQYDGYPQVRVQVIHKLWTTMWMKIGYPQLSAIGGKLHDSRCEFIGATVKEPDLRRIHKFLT